MQQSPPVHVKIRDKNKMIVITPSERFEINYEEEEIPPPAPPVSSAHRKYHKCNSCKGQFERSYQLKRHTFIAHNANRAVVIKPIEPIASSTPIKHVLANNVVIRKVEPASRQLVVTQAKPTQPHGGLQIRSPATINASKQAAPNPVALFKSPIFTNGSIQFRTVASTPIVPAPPPTQPPPRCSLPLAPNQNKGSAVVGKGNQAVPRINPDKPRIIVRKDPAGQSAKFDESTKNEWSQIVYEISSNGLGVIFRCAVCDRSYESLVAMDSHLQCHNGLAFRYKCELCDEFVASVAHLRNHVHSHTCSQQLPFRCDRCEERFENQSESDDHDCQSEPSAICQLCRQTFLTDSLLRSHQFFHSRVKPYKCGSCDTRFIHLSALAKHKEVETSCSMLTAHA